MEMRSEGRFSVMRCLTLGEPGSLEVRVTNLEDGSNTAGSVSGSEISGSSANSLVGEILPETSEIEIGSLIYSVVYD